MIRHLRKIASLMIGLFILLVGHGLIGTLLGVSGAKAGMTATDLGIVTGGYAIGFIAGSRLTTRLIGAVGHIRYFSVTASACSAAIILHGLVVDVWVWTVLRTICGFCMVGIYVAVESWLNQQTAAEQRGGVFSFYMTVSMLALAVGQGLLVLNIDPLGLFALTSIAFSLGLVPIAMTRQPEPVLEQAPPVSLLALYRSSPLGVLGTLAAGLINSSFYGLAAVYALERGLSNGQIAVFMASTIVGGALSLFGVGRFSDHRDRRHVLIGILFLTSLASLALLTPELGTRSIVGVLSGLAFGAVAFNVYSLSSAHLHDYLPPSQALAATSGLQTVYGAGSIIGPLSTGVLMHYLGSTAFVGWITGIALLAALFGVYRTTRREAAPAEQQSEYIYAALPSTVVVEATSELDSDEYVPLPSVVVDDATP